MPWTKTTDVDGATYSRVLKDGGTQTIRVLREIPEIRITTPYFRATNTQPTYDELVNDLDSQLGIA